MLHDKQGGRKLFGHNKNDAQSKEQKPLIGCQVLRAILDLLPHDETAIQNILAEEHILARDVYKFNMRIKLHSYLRILDRLEELTGDELFGLNMSQKMGPDMVGAVGYIFMSSPNLQAALHKFSEHIADIQDVTELRADVFDNGMWVSYNFTDEHVFPRRQDVEFSLGYIATLVRKYLGGSFAPLEVHFEHEARASISSYEKIFGCDVFFEQRENRLLISKDDLQRQCDRFDANLIPMLEGYLKYTPDMTSTTETYTDMVGKIIQDFINDGRPMTMPLAASRLGLSEIQLRARLKSEDASFKEILLRKRMNLARRLLADSRLSILEIAQKCGYAETASFTRAFSAYAAQTPSVFRRENR